MIARGVREHVHARRIEIADPTGAGDAFLAAYTWARASGHGPISAARQAATTAARVLELELEPARTDGVSALVRTVDGVFEVDLDTETVLGEVEAEVDHDRLDVNLPRLVAASAGGSTVVALVARRPPLLVSWDAGATWHESGGGLPPGFDVAVDSAAPDRVLYAARNRLYLSLDGGRFWRSLAAELPDIEAVAWSTES